MVRTMLGIRFEVFQIEKRSCLEDACCVKEVDVE